VGRQILLAQNPSQNFKFDPLPGSEESHVIVANDFLAFEVDWPYEKQRIYDLVAVF
jgi:hypothetical protein